MLSIEWIHKRVRLFRLELSLDVVTYLAAFMFLWQLFSMLRILK